MLSTREQCGIELKKRVAKRTDIDEIARWAFRMRSNCDNDSKLDDILLVLGCMDSGPEFTYSYERLNEIADDLIVGREVILNY